MRSQKVGIVACGVVGKALEHVTHVLFEAGREFRDDPNGEDVTVFDSSEDLLEALRNDVLCGIIGVGVLEGKPVTEFLEEKAPGHGVPIREFDPLTPALVVQIVQSIKSFLH